MNFAEMLIMVGPSGVPCAHSIIDEKTGRAKNNHWMINDGGILVARGVDYTKDYEVGSVESYKNGELKPPRLLTVMSGGIVELEVSETIVRDQSWSLAEMEIVKEAITAQAQSQGV